MITEYWPSCPARGDVQGSFSHRSSYYSLFPSQSCIYTRAVLLCVEACELEQTRVVDQSRRLDGCVVGYLGNGTNDVRYKNIIWVSGGTMKLFGWADAPKQTTEVTSLDVQPR